MEKHNPFLLSVEQELAFVLMLNLPFVLELVLEWKQIHKKQANTQTSLDGLAGKGFSSLLLGFLNIITSFIHNFICIFVLFS